MKYLIITNCLFTQIYLFKTHLIILISFASWFILPFTIYYTQRFIYILRYFNFIRIIFLHWYIERGDSFIYFDILKVAIHFIYSIYFSSPIHLNSMIYSLIWFAFIWWNIFNGDHSLPHHDIFILQIRFYFEKYLLLQLI